VHFGMVPHWASGPLVAEAPPYHNCHEIMASTVVEWNVFALTIATNAMVLKRNFMMMMMIVCWFGFMIRFVWRHYTESNHDHRRCLCLH
jgi:hypothetical protein